MPNGDRFSTDLTGKTLEGRFRVDRELARGGMGTVYQAHDETLHQSVVVKVPLPEVLMMEGFRSRFDKEIQELLALRHPHIVRVLSRGEHEQVPYFVLEYLGGGSLSSRIKAQRDKRLDPAEVATWLPDIAATLDFVHDRDIVHRDVKPANILFDDHGHVFLSDFGIAKAIGGTQLGMTSTGIPIGSPPVHGARAGRQ